MLKRILDDRRFRNFIEANLQKSPIAVPCLAMELSHTAKWPLFESLTRIIPEKDVLVVKNGQLSKEVPRKKEHLNKLLVSGSSVVLRGVERFNPSLYDLSVELEHQIPGKAVAQLYATPGGYHSFGWHYDAEEVFIVQTEGEKNYYLRENTINPHPSLDSMPENMHYERETTPIWTVRLIPGDFLYIPGGWWHVAIAHTSSLSISVGLLPAPVAGGRHSFSI